MVAGRLLRPGLGLGVRKVSYALAHQNEENITKSLYQFDK
jgi:hypothetical protein